MGWATFWAIFFSQTHPVTLVPNPAKRRFLASTVNRRNLENKTNRVQLLSLIPSGFGKRKSRTERKVKLAGIQSYGF
jgi:hypothetical protein